MEVQKTLEGMNVFTVGAGALGCEFLKSFALIGLCTSGKLTVTDMDNIEAPKSIFPSSSCTPTLRSKETY